MSNLAIKEIDGVEFYVASDGKECGVSVSGLSRLCGIHQSAMSNALVGIEGNGKNAPKALQHLQGIVFNLSVTGSNGAKIVSSEASAVIIEYYAFESKAKNETALFSFRKFAKMGMDSWIKNITGYQDTIKTTTDPELMSLMSQLIGKVDNIERKLDGYSKVATVYPTVDKLAFSDGTLALPTVDRYTIREWLTEYHPSVDLGKSDYFRLCSAVSLALKAMSGYYPENRSNGKGTPIRVYRPEHFKLMEECLIQLRQPMYA